MKRRALIFKALEWDYRPRPWRVDRFITRPGVRGGAWLGMDEYETHSEALAAADKWVHQQVSPGALAAQYAACSAVQVIDVTPAEVQG